MRQKQGFPKVQTAFERAVHLSKFMTTDERLALAKMLLQELGQRFYTASEVKQILKQEFARYEQQKVVNQLIARPQNAIRTQR